ncbi:proton pump-interactor 1 [Phtheirospermum japonicum]|uniref:Proton pump-interactor 1 n=1 Tax=Phtheirospermum japonicum TaxID=374723 RepID=A0A830AWI6_9LAMI|nr:proton pump-interactor 1 [Phtheirospermum japonicum]
MGVEVVQSNLSVDEVGKVDIKFGSHADEPATGDLNKLSGSNLPKDAVDEWPEPAQIHSFYIVKYRALEDRNLKAKLDVAERELQKKNQARLQLFEKLKTKRAERAQIRTQIHTLSVENKQFRTVMDEKKKEMEPLQNALGKLRGPSAVRERSTSICSSEDELNRLIKSYQYRIQHESIPLSEEKQILREIKLLEGTRPQVIANAAERARIQDSMGEKDSIQEQVKSIGVDLDGVRKEKQVVFAKIKQLDEEKVAIEKEIDALEEELNAVTEKRDTILDSVNGVRKQREEGNSPFYQNRTLLTKAKVLAAKKDVEAVKELSDSEGEKFMSLWNSSKPFRDDYETRILQSLDMRQLSKDGRMRNFDEKPLVLVETPQVQPEPEVVNKKQPTEETTKISAKSKNLKEGNKTEIIILEEKIDEPEVKVQKDTHSKKNEVDETKLKELKREEEIAKRNQAEERKKKLAEKAAAKAAIKAQKEAEKKLKEREKRARKNSGAPAESEEPTDETVEEVAEPAKVEEKTETRVPQKNKDRKEHTIRNRATRARGPDTLPKAILKRKKATNYWVSAVPAALAVLVLLVIGYSYLS